MRNRRFALARRVRGLRHHRRRLWRLCHGRAKRCRPIGGSLRRAVGRAIRRPSRPPRPQPSTAAAESTAPAASVALPSVAIPSFNEDKDLEALLPATFGGVTLQKFSIKGAEFLGQSSDPDIQQGGDRARA